MNILNQYINQILLVLFVALFGFLGAQAKNLWKRYVNTEVKQNIVRTTVRYVEQIYKDLDGPAKLKKAIQRASELLEGYGILISEEELTTMIEAAVNEFNNAFFKHGGGKHLPDEEKPVEGRDYPTVDQIIDNTGW